MHFRPGLASLMLLALCATPSGGTTPSDEPRYTGLLRSSQDELESVEVHPPLAGAAADIADAVELTGVGGFMPPAGHQGRQKSCAAWAVAYGYRSYLQARATPGWKFEQNNKLLEDRVFSPAYIYNQRTIQPDDKGMTICESLRLLEKNNCCVMKLMPYDELDSVKRPSDRAKVNAKEFRKVVYKRIPFSQSNIVERLKQMISMDTPIIIAMDVDDYFKYHSKDKIWTLVDKEVGKKEYHAMLIVGYSDTIKATDGSKGAFQVLNSWGSGWGNNGLGWISYGKAVSAIEEAFVIDLQRPEIGLKEDLRKPTEAARVVAYQSNTVNKVLAAHINRAEVAQIQDTAIDKFAHALRVVNREVQQNGGLFGFPTFEDQDGKMVAVRILRATDFTKKFVSLDKLNSIKRTGLEADALKNPGDLEKRPVSFIRRVACLGRVDG